MPKRKQEPVPVYYVKDEGCAVAPACLACPLPRCRYEVAGGIAAIQVRARADVIVAARAAGEPVASIAARLGISRRSVFRVTAGGGR